MKMTCSPWKTASFILLAILTALAFYPGHVLGAQETGKGDAVSSSPAAPKAGASKYDTTTMTGSWGGLRDEWEAKGVTIGSGFMADVFSNPIGGKYRGTAYTHSWGADLTVDLEKAAHLEGWKVHMSGLWRVGRDLAADKIGNVFRPSCLYGHQQVRFYSLDVEKRMFDNMVSFKFGRMAPGDDFGQSPLYWLAINNAIDGNPISLPINLPFLTYPNAVWGMRAKIDWTKIFYTTTGVYNGDSNVQRDTMHGLDLSLNLHKGVLIVHEFAMKPNDFKGAQGLPGHYKIGAYYHTGNFDDQYKDGQGNSYVVTGRPPKTHQGNYGFYFHLDQMLYREGGPGTDRGFTPFIALTLAPPDTNQFTILVESGLVYKGLFAGRKNDTTTLGFAYGKWSNTLADSQRDDRDIKKSGLDPQIFEAMFELTHRFQLTPWCYFQPSVQYLINPGGRGDISDAVAIGSRLGLTF